MSGEKTHVDVRSPRSNNNKMMQLLKSDDGGIKNKTIWLMKEEPVRKALKTEEKSGAARVSQNHLKQTEPKKNREGRRMGEKGRGRIRPFEKKMEKRRKNCQSGCKRNEHHIE